MRAFVLVIAAATASSVSAATPGLGGLRFDAADPRVARSAPVVSPLGAPLQTPAGPDSTVTTPTVLISNHGLGIRATGAVVAWGQNNFGQITIPAGLGALNGIATGQFHSLALRADGTLRGWGSNEWGQISPPGGLGAVRTVETGADHNSLILTDGRVRVFGCETCPFQFGFANVPPGVQNIVEIDAEGPVTIARRADGRLFGWGDTTPPSWPLPPISCGQSDVPQGLTDVVQIAAGTLHGLALRAGGTVVAWGALCPESNFGQADVPPGLTGVVAIAAGAQHSLAVRSDGTVVGWGLDNFGQATPPPGLRDVIAVDAKLFLSLALRRDGTVVAWGGDLNNGGVLNTPTVRFLTPPSPCRPDVNGDGELTFDDVAQFVALFNAGDARADFNADAEFTFDDITLFIAAFNAGC